MLPEHVLPYFTLPNLPLPYLTLPDLSLCVHNNFSVGCYQTSIEKAAQVRRLLCVYGSLQVTHRFRDAQIVEDMERIGLQIEGMPVLEETTAASIATIEVSRHRRLTRNCYCNKRLYSASKNLTDQRLFLHENTRLQICLQSNIKRQKNTQRLMQQVARQPIPDRRLLGNLYQIDGC